MTISRFAALLIVMLCSASALAEFEPVDISPLHDKVSVRLNQHGVIILFDRRGGRLVNPRIVAEPPKGQPYVRATLEELGGAPALVISSTFPKMVRYHAAARDDGKHEWYRVNAMYGLLPKVPNAEAFRRKVGEFVLYDFALTNEKLDQNSTNEDIRW